EGGRARAGGVGGGRGERFGELGPQLPPGGRVAPVVDAVRADVAAGRAGAGRGGEVDHPAVPGPGPLAGGRVRVQQQVRGVGGQAGEGRGQREAGRGAGRLQPLRLVHDRVRRGVQGDQVEAVLDQGQPQLVA